MRAPRDHADFGPRRRKARPEIAADAARAENRDLHAFVPRFFRCRVGPAARFVSNPNAAMLAALPALIAMLAVQILISFSSQTAPVLAPLAAPAIGFDPVWVGYFVGASYGCAATAGLISGNFIARYGAIRTSQVCLGFCAFGMALAAGGVPVLVGLSAIVVGFGYGPATPSSSHILARVSPPGSVNLIFSIKQTGVPLGGALAGALAPSLALAFGWQTTCLIVGACALSLAFVIQPFRERLDATRDRDRAPFAFRRSAAVLFQI